MKPALKTGVFYTVHKPMGLWFQAMGILCDHGADTRHRTDMGASCVLLAACAPAPNALEEIFKRQGEAPDLKLDFQSDIGKGAGFNKNWVSFYLRCQIGRMKLLLNGHFFF